MTLAVSVPDMFLQRHVGLCLHLLIRVQQVALRRRRRTPSFIAALCSAVVGRFLTSPP